MRKSPDLGPMVCTNCGEIVTRRTARQLYCTPCSGKRDTARKTAWARTHHQERNPLVVQQRQSAIVAKGAEVSKENRGSMTWTSDPSEADELVHIVRVTIPFDWAASKNAVWRFGRGGHVIARRESVTFRRHLALLIANAGGEWYDGKVWIDLFVEKPSHKGDAINLIDLVCDAVKDAIGVDDRWYAIRRLDWAIVKESADPRIIVGIAQAVTEHHRACSHCGRVLPLVGNFSRNRSDRIRGHNRACKTCSSTRKHKG